MKWKVLASEYLRKEPWFATEMSCICATPIEWRFLYTVY